MSQKEASQVRWNLEERRRVLRGKRRDLGFSQDRLARLAGISKHSLTMFESGRRDLKLSTLEKLEEAVSDAMAGQRLVELSRAQRIQAGALARMAPPQPGTEDYWQARTQFVQQGSTTITELTLNNARLTEEVAVLKGMVSKLEEQARNWHEIAVLQDEVIRQQEALLPNKSKEAAAMLRRAKLLKAGAR